MYFGKTQINLPGAGNANSESSKAFHDGSARVGAKMLVQNSAPGLSRQTFMIDTDSSAPACGLARRPKMMPSRKCDSGLRQTVCRIVDGFRFLKILIHR